MNLWKTLIAAGTVLLIAGGTIAQDWGPMQEVYWHNPPRFNLPGAFNPSFCDSDSTLYFDDFLRFFFAYGVIYSSKLLGRNEYGQLEWTDPESLPSPINIPGYLNACPSITSGGDTLFFCSNRPGTHGRMDIWMSTKTDSVWSDPINLGDSINSETDELKPFYAANSRTLFFDRLENIHTYLYGIYNSTLNIDNTWGSAIRLPEIINRIDTGSYGAFYDDMTNTLYFTSSNREDSNLAIFISLNSNSVWGEPQLLTENINGFWFPNVCGSHETENGWLTSSRRIIFFDKMIWEASCIDFYAGLFYSENNTSIYEIVKNNEDDNDIVIYPNPSNSKFIFSFNGNYGRGKLSIYNIQGQLVSSCIIEQSTNNIIWEAADKNINLTSGIYFAHFSFRQNTICKKLILLR